MAMRLCDLITELTPLRVDGETDLDVSGIAYDSRRVFPGMMFVAMPGQRGDGHDHVYSAIDRGACAVVCERNGLALRRAACIRVRDSRAALARASARFYGHPSQALGVVGITGTNGKTTVAFLVHHLLRHAGHRAGLISTVRYEVGDRTIPAQRTTPEALDLQCMLAQMCRSNCRYCVLEVSSHALAQRRVDEVAFDVGVFTNLTHDHLDYHGSVEAYYATKRRLFASLSHGAKAATALINIDDPAGARLAKEFPGLRRCTYGLRAGADIQGRIVAMGSEGSRLGVETPAGSFECSLPLIGRFNVANALAATGVGLALGLPPLMIGEALGTVPQVPGRLERLEVGQPFRVLVDYAHTEDALQNVLNSLREITPGRILLAFGCGGERDPLKRAPMGTVAGRLADEVLVTTDNPRSEPAELIVEGIVAGFRPGQRARWRVEPDRARAIEGLIQQARAGDTVLLAGKGHESYQEFQDTVVPFDDRSHALEALESLGWRDGQVGGSGNDTTDGMRSL
jgi:UDP-N-acetylmuramoyl-L-alanyl-D-glutamate--2,6-diaminopimelate ligase